MLKSSFKKKNLETTELSKALGHFRDVPNCTRIKWYSPQYQLRLADGDRTHASRRTSLITAAITATRQFVSLK